MAIIIMMMMLMKMRAMMMRPCGAVQLLDVEAEAGVDIGEDDDIDGNNDDKTIGDGGITVDFWIINRKHL